MEGLITTAVLVFLYENRPELLRQPFGEGRAGKSAWSRKKTLGVLTGLALVLGGAVSHFASEDPDGLEWSLARLTGSPELDGPAGGIYGLAARIQEVTALFPDYQIPGLEAGWGTAFSGIIGTVLVLGLIHLAGRKLTGRQS